MFVHADAIFEKKETYCMDMEFNSSSTVLPAVHFSLSDSIYFDVWIKRSSQSLCDNINIIIMRRLFTLMQFEKKETYCMDTEFLIIHSPPHHLSSTGCM